MVGRRLLSREITMGILVRHQQVGKRISTGSRRQRVFATAMAVLMAEFNAYLDRDGADPTADLVGYRQHALWLTRQELEQLIVDLRQAILPRLAHRQTPERGRYLLSPIHFPAEEPTQAGGASGDA
jgi:hypothetical protein